MIPRGSATPADTIAVMAASSALTGTRSAISFSTERPVMNDSPALSVRMPSIHEAYCTASGRSVPSLCRRAASWSAVARELEPPSPPLLRISSAGSPGMTRRIAKTTRLTSTKVGTISRARFSA